PFLVLVGRDGNVIALHTRGQQLAKKLEELLGDSPAAPAEKPADPPAESPADAAPAESPADAAPAETPAPAPDSADDAADSAASERVFRARFVTFTNDADAEEQADEAEEADKPAGETRNPYLAPSGLTDAELVDFLFDMQEKPKSIRYREGFSAAIVDAADRLL